MRTIIVVFFGVSMGIVVGVGAFKEPTAPPQETHAVYQSFSRPASDVAGKIVAAENNTFTVLFKDKKVRFLTAPDTLITKFIQENGDLTYTKGMYQALYEKTLNKKVYVTYSEENTTFLATKIIVLNE